MPREGSKEYRRSRVGMLACVPADGIELPRFVMTALLIDVLIIQAVTAKFYVAN